MNKKIVISSAVSDEKINQKAIRSTEWKKTGYLEVRYKEQTKSNWKHMFQLTDEAGIEILNKEEAVSAKWQLSSLRKLFAAKKEIKIYMIISPPNSMMAAPSRMIHLGTLKLP
jgi:DNA polymerase II small subunit/DNA polymerase delta subunit B